MRIEAPGLIANGGGSSGPSQHFTYEQYAKLDRRVDPESAFGIELTPEGYKGRGGAGVLIVTDDFKKVLLVRRAAGLSAGGEWSVPGGARDRISKGNESPIVAAISEVREELGVVPRGLLRKKPFFFVRPGTSFSYTTYVLELDKAAAAAFAPKLNWENSAWKWFDLASLGRQPGPDKIHPGVLVVVDGFELAPGVPLRARAAGA